MPGYTERTADAGRVILYSAVKDPASIYPPGGVQMDPDNSYFQGEKVIPAGTPVYRQSSGLHRPWVAATADGAGTSSTALTVDDASGYAVGDAIYVGSTATTVSAVDYGTNVITLAAAATWTDGAAIHPSNGYAAANPVVGIVSDEFGVDLSADRLRDDDTARIQVAGPVKAWMVYGFDALKTSIDAGDQPLIDELTFWQRGYRVA
ncbi:hypothetical protein [Alienimonas sp. DA493]|uniref:hypothetical protein n=1 Tax=Alienimonas sp. DA493 TaxID=3373605 RepID=UPI0037553293